MSRVVVIGAGHNGLTAAALLARAGRSVTVLERRPVAGGICAGEAFHGGYRHLGLLHDTCRVRPWVVQELGLTGHGLQVRDRPSVFVTGGDTGGLLVPDGLSEADRRGWSELHGFIGRVRGFAASVLDARAPRIGDDAELWPLFKSAVGLRRLGTPDMMELLKIGPTCANDWVGAFLEDRRARAALCAGWMPWTWMGPRSPTGTAMLLHAEALAGQEVVGGPAALVAALEAACKAVGVQIRTGVEVTGIEVDSGAVTGVRIGEEAVDAEVVLSAIGPRQTLLELVHPAQVHPLIERDVSDIRVRGTMAKVHLALTGAPTLTGAQGMPERILVAEDPRTLEQAFDDAKHRRMPRRPALDVRWLTGDGIAPAGHGVLSVVVLGAAHDLDGGWTDAQRTALEKAVVARLAEVMPDLGDRIAHVETLTPADLEARYALEGGHPFHGEHALDQLWVMRPTAALAQHSTPIRGLFLGSAGVHPGGDITCGPGGLAAKAVLG